MKKTEFSKRVNEIVKAIKTDYEVENLTSYFKTNWVSKYGAQAVFAYAHWCEYNFENNLREDYKRKTTYTSDFSIAEWCVPMEGINGIADTFKNALMNWRDNIEYFAEIVMVLNMKSWEHHARGNVNYSCLYADLYYFVKDLYFDWFDEDNEQHKKAMEYYFDFVD